MDYLRRLHPAHAAHAARGSAARLDAPTAMAATAALPRATFDEPAPPPADAARSQSPNAVSLGASQSPLTEPSPRAAPLAEAAASRAAPHHPSAVTPLPPMQAVPLALSPSVLPARAAPPSIDALVPQVPSTAASPLMQPDLRPLPSARQREPSAVVVALQPLRPEALREREHAAADEPAPVIHVTIDRIDVRLPSAAATPPAAARRRAAPAVGTLGDYLRGRPPEGRQ